MSQILQIETTLNVDVEALSIIVLSKNQFNLKI